MDYYKELQKRKHLIRIITQKYSDLGNPLPDLFLEHAGRMAICTTHIASASTWDMQFYGEAKRMGLTPVWAEYKEDTFLSLNGRKKMFLHTTDKYGNTTKLSNASLWEKKKFSEIVIDNGESLVSYHNNLWEKEFGDKKAFRFDISPWFNFFGTSEDYYEHLSALIIAFGVEFWPDNIGHLYRKGEKESFWNGGTLEIGRKKAEEEYGFPPLEYLFNIVSHIP